MAYFPDLIHVKKDEVVLRCRSGLNKFLGLKRAFLFRFVKISKVF